MKTTTEQHDVTEQQKVIVGNTVEAFTRLSEVAFSGMERLTALNLNVARESLQEAVEASLTLTRAHDIKDLGHVTNPLTAAGAERLTAYVRGVQEILSETQSDFAEVIGKQVSSFSTNGPKWLPGMEAFETIARQTADMTKAYVLSTTEATEKAIATTSQRVRKSA